jgi:hypothetical protein
MASVCRVTNASIEPTPSASGNASTQRSRRRTQFGAVVGAAALAVTVAACGGDDDDAADTTVPTTVAAAVTTQPSVTVAAPTTTAAAAVTTMPDLVTEGATVVVANASRVDGGAGRLSDRLALAEFTMGTPADSTEGPLEVSKVYYNASVEGALPVAESIRVTLGGPPIELLELPTPPPVASGEIGDATVLVAMGNDIVDIPLDQLQGLVTTTTVASSSGDTGTTVDPTASTNA